MSRDFIEALFRKYYGDLLRYARAILADPQEVEDAVQDVFKIACSKDAQRDLDIKMPWPWLKKILRNVASNYKRKDEKRDHHEVSIETIPEEISAPSQSPAELRAKYSGIADDEDLEILIYKSTTKATYQEIADKFGIVSAEACRKRIKRALTDMKKKL